MKEETEYRSTKKELEFFLSLMDLNEDFKIGLQTLLFNKSQKLELINFVNDKAKFNQKTVNFLLTLIEENRLVYLDQILLSMEHLWNEMNGIQSLVVHSAIPINNELENKLILSLERAFKKKIKLDKRIDDSLIAGIKIQKGSVFYDFSIAGNLVKLKNALIEE